MTGSDQRPHPTRVVVLNDRSLAFGGATGLALLSARLLWERGIPVTLLAGDAGENPALAAVGIPVHALGGSTLLQAGAAASLGRGLYNPATVRLVGEWIRRHDDPGTVYHLHTWAQILSPSVFRALEPVRDRLFVSAHDFFLTCPNGAYALFRQGAVCPHVPLGFACVTARCDRRSYAHKLWRVARQVVQTRTLRYDGGFPRVLAIHAGMRPFLVRGGVPDAAITTLPNPIQPWSATRIPAERNGAFVFVGRLNEEKGPDLAAKAARAAGVPRVVIGDGPLLDAMRRDYPEVRFAGRQPAEVVARMVREARALVMPSRYPEPYGLVAGEALWSGLPVILTDQALLAADIVAREAGLAFDPHSGTALADAMRRMARDDVLTERMSRNAHERMSDIGHRAETWIDAMLDAYGTIRPGGSEPVPSGAVRVFCRPFGRRRAESSADPRGTIAPGDAPLAAPEPDRAPAQRTDGRRPDRRGRCAEPGRSPPPSAGALPFPLAAPGLSHRDAMGPSAPMGRRIPTAAMDAQTFPGACRVAPCTRLPARGVNATAPGGGARS